MNPRIEINPNVCHGSPVVRGTRVLVSQILGALSGGDSVETVLEDYPGITSEDISAVFDFAGQGLRPHGARQAQSGFMWHIRRMKEDCHV